MEALSRGAAEAVFVESQAAAAEQLRGQLERFGGAARGSVLTMDAARYLGGSGQPFDLVFLDPPFGREALREYLPLLERGSWVKVGGLVYLESERASGPPELPAHWEPVKSKFAGEVGYHLARVNTRSDQ